MLLIFALLVIAGSVHASVIDCDQVPPAFWCLNQTLIEECEWNVPCSKYLAKSKGQKIPVTVMYLTQCPACRRYISGELQEVYSNHGDKLDIELAPVGGDHKYPKEVNGSKYDACLIKYVKEPVRFIGCVEQRIDQGPEAAGQECFKQFQTDAATIDHVNRCYKGAEGEELAKAYVARIYSAHPTRPHVVPWFVISNVSLKAIQGYRNDLGFAAKHFYVPNDVSKKIFLTEDKSSVTHLLILSFPFSVISSLNQINIVDSFYTNVLILHTENAVVTKIQNNTEMAVGRLLLAISALISVISLQVVYGRIICDKLPVEVCAFSVSSSGARCVLEKSILRDGNLQYECQSSEVIAENMKELIETDECMNACGVGRMTVGMSTDSLAEHGFTNKLCCPQCYNKCPNIIDLYFNLAAGEGVYLPRLCQAHRSGDRRMMSEFGSYAAAPATIGFGDITISPTSAPSPVSS